MLDVQLVVFLCYRKCFVIFFVQIVGICGIGQVYRFGFDFFVFQFFQRVIYIVQFLYYLIVIRYQFDVLSFVFCFLCMFVGYFWQIDGVGFFGIYWIFLDGLMVWNYVIFYIFMIENMFVREGIGGIGDFYCFFVFCLGFLVFQLLFFDIDVIEFDRRYDFLFLKICYLLW